MSCLVHCVTTARVAESFAEEAAVAVVAVKSPSPSLPVLLVAV